MRLQSRWKLKPRGGKEVGEGVFLAYKRQGAVGIPRESGVAELSKAEVKNPGWAGSDKR